MTRFEYFAVLRCVGGTIVAGVAMVAATANAATPNETAALKQFEEGKHAYEKKDYATALKDFQDSLQLLPSPNTRLYIARCYRELHKPASAFTAYRLAAREASDRLNATGEKRYKATRETAISESAEIEAKVPRLTVAVPSDAPEGTVVKVDDAELPKAAWGVAVETDPGDHAIAATSPRRQPFTTKVTLGEGDQKRVEVTIPRLPTGTIAFVLKSRPSGMEIDVDGTPLDSADWERIREVDTGSHHVEAHAPGYVDFSWSGDVADGQRAEIPIALEAQKLPTGSRKSTPKWAFYGVAGLSIASIGVASYLAVDAKSISNDEQAKNKLLRTTERQDKIRTLSTEANILFIAGSALAVGAGVLFFTTDWKSSEPRPEPQTGFRVAPWAGPTGGGLVGTGAF